MPRIEILQKVTYNPESAVTQHGKLTALAVPQKIVEELHDAKGEVGVVRETVDSVKAFRWLVYLGENGENRVKPTDAVQGVVKVQRDVFASSSTWNDQLLKGGRAHNFVKLA
jgi:hypothetical protein